MHFVYAVFIPIVTIMFRKKDDGISVVTKKAFRNRNVFLTTTIDFFYHEKHEGHEVKKIIYKTLRFLRDLRGKYLSDDSPVDEKMDIQHVTK
jgi:hypothetical protein